MVLSLFIRGRAKGLPAIAKINLKVNIINSLQARILIRVDILALEQYDISFKYRILTLYSYELLVANINVITRKDLKLSKVILSRYTTTTILPGSISVIPISYKGVLLLDRDILFELLRP